MSQKITFLTSRKSLLMSRNISYFCFKNKPILNPFGKNVLKRELKSMSEIVYTTINGIKQQHGYKVSTGKPLNWIISNIK